LGINLLTSQKTYIRAILNDANYFAKATELISFIFLPTLKIPTVPEQALGIYFPYQGCWFSQGVDYCFILL